MSKKIKILLLCLLAVLVLALGFLAFNREAQSAKNAEKNSEMKAAAPETGKKDDAYFAPIFTFHNIATAPAKADKATQSLYVPPAELEKILQDLQKNNYKTLFASEMAAYLAKGEHAPKDTVALTFDDGLENFYTNALPLLKKYNMKASLYIMTGVRSPEYLTTDQMKEIDKTGLVEIGSHTVYHADLPTKTPEEQDKELRGSKKMLEDLLGHEISVICYPYGDYNSEVEALAKSIGYKYGLSYNHHPLADTGDVFAIDRAGVWPGMNVLKFLQDLND